MQQDVADLKQRPTAPANPYAAFDHQGPFHGYQYPAAWEYRVQYGPHSIGQPGRSVGQSYPTEAVGPTPQQLDYALRRGSQYHVAAFAEGSPQRTNQTGNVGVKDGNSSARSSYTGATPRRGGLAQRGTTRGRGPFHRCGQQGHFARNCQNSSQGPHASAQQGPDKVQVVTDRNSKRDEYICPSNYSAEEPLHYLTGCDTSIIGSRMLPKNVQL